MENVVLKVEGMRCPMCEAHVNDALRAKLPSAKVSSSHKKGVAEIVSDEAVPESMIAAALDGSGYGVLSVSSEPYEKKRFSLFGRRK